MPYIGVSPQFGVRRKHTYTATAGQTIFTGAGSEGATLSYTDSNFVDVYQNGVKLGDADYTSTTGTQIELAQAASVSDLIEIIVFDAFSAADTVSKSDGGTFDGNVTMGGTLGVTGAATLSSTLGVTGASTLTGALSAKGGVVFNEDSADVDFRVESNNIDDALFVQGSDGFVGIGTQSPSSPLDIEYIDGGVQLKIGRTNTTAGSAWFGADANALNIGVGAYGSGGGNVTTPNGIKVSSIGAVTKPYQPAFLTQGTGQTNLPLNSTTTILFDSPIFDQNLDFDASTETFTAPVTGKYQLNASVRCDSVDNTTQYTNLQIVTSNKMYSFIWTNNGFDADLDYFTFVGSVLADMDAGDTAQIKIYLPSLGTAQLDVIGGNNTFFSGCLVC